MNLFTTNPVQPAINPSLMDHYESYPHLWTPPVMPSLFLVRVPAVISTLDEQTYLILMQQRVTWMIHRWTLDTARSQLVKCTPLSRQKI